MTEFKDSKESLESFVEENTGANLFFLMNALHRIGGSLKRHKSFSSLCIVVHDEYQTICTNKLSRKALKLYHDIMEYGTEDSKELINTINTDLVDFAAWEITLGRVPILEWDHDKYDLQIIEGLHKIGLSWHETMKRNPYGKLDSGIEIPIIFPENHEHLYHEFINLNGLVNGAVNYRRAVLDSNMINEKKKFESLDLNDTYISIGQYLFNEGTVPIKLYKD